MLNYNLLIYQITALLSNLFIFWLPRELFEFQVKHILFHLNGNMPNPFKYLNINLKVTGLEKGSR